VSSVSRPVQRAGGEQGSVLVELALVLPLFLALVLGLVSTGIVYNHKLDLVHAAREGARYGATVPVQQCTPSTKCSGKTWAQLVQTVVVQRSDGDVTTDQVCVALVTGTTGAPIDSTFTTKSDGTSCYDDGNTDTAARVQVRIRRSGDSINAAFIKIPVTLTTNADAKFEL
jgi:Flp pilus assembly protein TadG